MSTKRLRIEADVAYLGPSRHFAATSNSVTLGANADIERFSACTERVAFDPCRKSRLLPNGSQPCRENPLHIWSWHLEKTPKQFSVLQQTFHHPPDHVCKILRPIEVEAMATWDDHNVFVELLANRCVTSL